MMTWYGRQGVAFKAWLMLNLMVVAAAGAWVFARGVSSQEVEPASRAALASAPKEWIEGKTQMVQTGNPLDLAIDGRGFFQVELPDGTAAYTRNGAFRLSQNGEIVTRDGLPLTPRVSVPGNYELLYVGMDGQILVNVPGDPARQTVGTIQLVRFMNPEGLKASRFRDLFFETEDSGTPTAGQPGLDGLGAVESGFLERPGHEGIQELFRVLSETASEAATVTPIQGANGVKQIIIVVNL